MRINNVTTAITCKGVIASPANVGIVIAITSKCLCTGRRGHEVGHRHIAGLDACSSIVGFYNKQILSAISDNRKISVIARTWLYR